jgi:WD40 repeat protein
MSATQSVEKSIPRPRRWFRPRFSLRTLLLLTLLIGGGTSLWLRWEPWPLVRTFNLKSEKQMNLVETKFLAFCSNEQKIVATTDNVIQVFDVFTGKLLASRDWTEPEHSAFSCEGETPFVAETGRQSRIIVTPLDANLRDKFARKFNAEFVDCPLHETVEFLGLFLKSKNVVELSPQVTKHHREDPVTVQISNQTIEESIRLIAKSVNLQFEVRDGKPRLETAAEAEIEDLITQQSSIFLWDLERNTAIKTLRAHGRPNIQCLALSENSMFAVAADFGKAWVWEVATSRLLNFYEFDQRIQPRSIQVSNDGQRVLCEGYGHSDGPCVVLGVSGQITKVLFADTQSRIHVSRIAPDTDLAIVGFEDPLGHGECNMRFLEMGKGREGAFAKFPVSSYFGAKCNIRISLNGQRVLFADGYHNARLLEAATGRDVCEIDRSAEGVVFSANSRRLILGRYEYIQVLDADSGELIQTLPNRARSLEDLWRWFRRTFIDQPIVNPFAMSGPPTGAMRLSRDGTQIVERLNYDQLGLWQRRRPEQWWGVAWLPEFWLTLLLAIGLMLSLWRDRSSVKATQLQPQMNTDELR